MISRTCHLFSLVPLHEDLSQPQEHTSCGKCEAITRLEWLVVGRVGLGGSAAQTRGAWENSRTWRVMPVVILQVSLGRPIGIVTVSRRTVPRNTVAVMWCR